MLKVAILRLLRQLGRVGSAMLGSRGLKKYNAVPLLCTLDGLA